MTRDYVHEIYRRMAALAPDRTAIEQGGEGVSYSALDSFSDRLAARLLGDGAEPGSLVGIVAATAEETIAAMLATLKAGCAFVPLDWTLPAERLATMIDLVELRRLLVAPRLRAAAGALLGGRGCRLLALARGDGAAGAPPVVAVDGDAIAYVYFTSGSTGTPKPIAGRLKAIDHFIRWEIDTFALESSCRVSQLTMSSFDAFLRDAFAPLCCGGTVCAPPDRDLVLEPPRLLDWIGGEQLTLVHCAPSLLRTFLDAGLTAERAPALRFVLCAGEPLLPNDVRRWYEAFGERARLANLYGPSETTMTKLCHLVTADDAARRSVPIGKPIRGAQAIAIDESGAPCPAGRPGEIYIRTPYRTLGYYRQPELTQTVFVPNPLSGDPTDVVYRTGDLGRMLADGSFEFLGRRDHQVKIRGLRVELGEIEERLRRHPAVADAVVVGRDDVSGNKFLCGYFVARQSVDAEALREHLAAALPAWMLPSQLVQLAELPRTPTGKVDRRALPVPTVITAGKLVPPRTAVEERLADLFCQLLRLDRVSIEDSFFALGGHSLLATQLLVRVRAAWNVEVPLRDLFRAPTVAALALCITNLQARQQRQEEVSDLLREIASLSEEEIDAALLEERRAGPAPGDSPR
ncbi:MAG TPA: non-ribosomal peptide synthetase [Thermoanaerobaculia bacterium]|nr:non-ribosomal peptide synthetase [Thermoanaerobaculia bacterium]